MADQWPTVLVDEVKEKPCNFKACLCGSFYSTFTTSFHPFYNKPLQTLFKDQLGRSKATCLFKGRIIACFFVNAKHIYRHNDNERYKESQLWMFQLKIVPTYWENSKNKCYPMNSKRAACTKSRGQGVLMSIKIDLIKSTGKMLIIQNIVRNNTL